MPRLYALADLHLSYALNREALKKLAPHPEDSLILAGDLGETTEHLRLAFEEAKQCFKHVWWVPGNHELYSVPATSTSSPDKLAESKLRGEAKYRRCVQVAHEYGVLTPEDDFATWEGDGGPVIVAPIFTLYDYSFRPADVSRDRALQWAEEGNTVATDEALLHADPHATRDDWCAALVAQTAPKLQAAADSGVPLVIVNHWPLREDLVYIPLVPRFSLWCGTKETQDWHVRYGAKVVVTGHLHVRRTDWKDGVRFEECSLGYPRQWEAARERGNDINAMLREILPGPPKPEGEAGETIWRRFG